MTSFALSKGRYGWQHISEHDVQSPTYYVFFLQFTNIHPGVNINQNNQRGEKIVSERLYVNVGF